MATLLYRLGKFAYRRAWYVIGAWIVILAAILGGGVALGGSFSESFSIPGTESQNALDRLEAFFPSVAGASVQVVVEAPDGATVETADAKKAIAEQVSAIEKIDGVDAVTGPFDKYAGKAVSDDKSMALIKVQFKGTQADVTPAMLTKLTDTASITRDAGMTVAFGGQVFQDQSFGVSIVEVFGLIFAAIVLIITFGSLLAAGMPLLTALLGVGIASGAIITVSAFTTVSSTAPTLALMIGLAVGIDYALFILSRHRNQLGRGEGLEESAGMAVGTAGSAVVFAGVTVIIALLGLLVVGIPFLSVMGVGAALAVLIAIGIATTLLPALMGLAKERLRPKEGSRTWRRANVPPAEKRTLGVRWVRIVMKAPVIPLILVVGILGTVAIPALSLNLNLPDNGSEPKGSTQREAYDMIAKGFGAGYNGPLIVEVDITQTTAIEDDLTAIGKQLNGLKGVDYVSQGFPDTGLDTAIIQVTPSSAPDSEATKALVQDIRNLAPSIEKKYDTPISVTGSTAIGIDISNKLSNALIPFGLIVVGLSVILLMMVFRSVLVPIKAAVGFLLSVVASFGIVVAVFQWGWFADLLGVANTGPILSFLPILLMAVLFGLAMDYEVFLVSGMREEFVKTGNARQSVERGFGNGARVVTAAALIMFFVFFSFVPTGSGSIKPIALGLASGIAIDAFLIRMTLVPAVMTLFGRAAWWMPKWLSRILPNVDVEGEQLREHREAVEWADGQDALGISAIDFYAGMNDRVIGPLELHVPVGGIAIASGNAVDRRLVAATLGGRLDLRSGRAQVAGFPLPSEAARIRSLVALADVGGVERAETTVTVGALLRERLEMTQPWYRMWSTRRRSREWLGRINAAARQASSRPTVEVTADSTLVALPQLERAVALAGVALAEATPVVMLDQLDRFGEVDGSAFVRAVDLLAPAETTLVIGTPEAPARIPATDRPVVTVDLNATPATDTVAVSKGGLE
jgi:putative drug exporter of the RND superfamily